MPVLCSWCWSRGTLGQEINQWYFPAALSRQHSLSRGWWPVQAGGRGVVSELPASLTGCLLLCVSRSYSYMIDNVILLITGTLHQRSIAELVPKCHPLGSFEQMEAVNIAQTPAELYNAILVDTPLGEPLWWREEVGISVSVSL